MSSSEALWLNIWEAFAAIGFIIVIIGVVIEGIEHFKDFPKKEHARKLRIEKIGWFLVVVGLAMEFLGDHAAKRIADRENARLNNQAGNARKDAAAAVSQAASANVLAAMIESNNLVLRSNVVVLELRSRRRISSEQTNAFINLLKQQWKVPVRIGVGATDSETETFAHQLREMLDASGYGVSNGDGIIRLGHNFTYLSTIEDYAADLPFGFVFYGIEGEELSWGDFGITFTKTGDTIYHYVPNKITSVPAILDFAFRQIGLKPGAVAWTNFPAVSKSGEWIIFVPQKF